jgi:hypothetical protein
LLVAELLEIGRIPRDLVFVRGHLFTPFDIRT